MSWGAMYNINIKIETKAGKEYIHTIECSTTSHVSYDDEIVVIAILNPYILCLSSDIDDLITKLKDGFVYDDFEDYNYKKAVRYFDDNHEFIKKSI